MSCSILRFSLNSKASLPPRRSLGLPTERYVEQILLNRFPEDDDGLREGLEDIAAGRTQPAREVLPDSTRIMAYEVRLSRRVGMIDLN
jgi:hypothetical protein